MFEDNPLLNEIASYEPLFREAAGRQAVVAGSKQEEELPGGYGVVTPFATGESLRRKMASKEPGWPGGAGAQGAAEFIHHNPGAKALEYALAMNGGIPDAVAVTASNMPWMALWRQGHGGKYPSLPEMQHTALGVHPSYYKMYNQIGGAGAYGGAAGASSAPVSSATLDSASREQNIERIVNPSRDMSPVEQKQYFGMWGGQDAINDMFNNMRVRGQWWKPTEAKPSFRT